MRSARYDIDSLLASYGMITRARKAAVKEEEHVQLREEGKLRDNPALIEGSAEFFASMWRDRL